MDSALNGKNLPEAIEHLADILGGIDRTLDDEARALAVIDRAAALMSHDRSSLQAAETLRVASMELARDLDLGLVLETLLDYLSWLLPYDHARVQLKEDGDMEPAASRDYRTDDERCGGDDWPSLAESEAAMEGKLARATPYPARASDAACGGTRLIVPMLWDDEPIGVIAAERLSNPMSEEQIRYAEALASQAAIAIRNARLFSELKRADLELVRSYDATIEGWSRALELRDHDTEGHTLRVTDMTLRLGRLTGLSESDLVHVRRGALLHDIGKVAIPDAVLLKPEPLTPAERVVMCRHPDYARSMLENIAFLRPALDIPYCHHERWDGTGYPQGLAGDAIPLAARLFTVVDVWDALTHDRPYHKAWTREKTLAYLATLSGTHFDPEVVKTFIAMVRSLEADAEK